MDGGQSPDADATRPSRPAHEPARLRRLAEGIALYTLATARNRTRARSVLGLNALVDAFDACVSMLEIRDRGGVDKVAAGGVAFNVAFLVCWTAAAVALRD